MPCAKAWACFETPLLIRMFILSNIRLIVKFKIRALQEAHGETEVKGREFYIQRKNKPTLQFFGARRQSRPGAMPTARSREASPPIGDAPSRDAAHPPPPSFCADAAPLRSSAIGRTAPKDCGGACSARGSATYRPSFRFATLRAPSGKGTILDIRRRYAFDNILSLKNQKVLYTFSSFTPYV